MPLSHAVLSINHHTALIQQFDHADVESNTVRTHPHYTRQHASGVRSEHEFYGEVCDALDGIKEILVAGAHKSQADFRHYVEKHRPALTARIVGWETVDNPTDAQLVALARNHFIRIDSLNGTRPLIDNP